MEEGDIERHFAKIFEHLERRLERIERGSRDDEAGNPEESAGNGPIAGRKFREATHAEINGQAEFAGAGMSTYAPQREQESLQRSRAAGPTPRDLDSERVENGILRMNTQGQPRGRDREDARVRRADAKIQELEHRVARMQRQPTVAERNELSAARHRADGVYSALGRETPSHLPGESPLSYRQRLCHGLKDLSPRCRRINMDGLSGGPLEVIEDFVYADASAACSDGSAFPPGTLRPHTYQDATGHTVTEYHGDPMGWMEPFMAAGARGKIIRPEGVKL